MVERRIELTTHDNEGGFLNLLGEQAVPVDDMLYAGVGVSCEFDTQTNALVIQLSEINDVLSTGGLPVSTYSVPSLLPASSMRAVSVDEPIDDNVVNPGREFVLAEDGLTTNSTPTWTPPVPPGP